MGDSAIMRSGKRVANVLRLIHVDVSRPLGSKGLVRQRRDRRLLVLHVTCRWCLVLVTSSIVMLVLLPRAS